MAWPRRGERRPRMLGAESTGLPRIWRTVNRRKPGTDPVAVLQAPQLARLPFGQFLVIIPDRLAKRRERPCHVGPGFHEPIKMGAIGFLAGEDGLAGPPSGARPPAASPGRPKPRSARFPDPPQRPGERRGHPSAVPLRPDSPGYVYGSRDSAGGSQAPGSRVPVILAGISGFSVSSRMRGTMSM